jgi:hypothetical protein
MWFMGYAGIQTPGYFQQWEESGGNDLHEYKNELGDYLASHSEVKLVIDFHGASATTNHWDVDIGLLGYNNNGVDGIYCNQPEELGGDGCANQLEQLTIGPTSEAFSQDPTYPDVPPCMDFDFIPVIVDTLFDNQIGHCPFDCAGGNLGDCEEISSNCPMGFFGHGPISFNDFAGSSQHTVTRFVNKFFGDNVNSFQLEASAIYRCLTGSTDENVIKFSRALQQIVGKAQYYYSGMGFGRQQGRDSGIDNGDEYIVQRGWSSSVGKKLGKLHDWEDNENHKRNRLMKSGYAKLMMNYNQKVTGDDEPLDGD